MTVPTPPPAPALELRDVSQHFGVLKAVDEVSFSVAAGARHAVIGPNGAGKSTLFALIAGTRRATGGQVLLAGRDVTAAAEHRRVALGIARTFQHSSLFLSATVLENVLMAVQRQAGVSWSMLRSVRRRSELHEQAHTFLQQVHLDDRHGATAGALSHGGRRQLEVAVALACRPTVLLLDEPAAGMSAADTSLFIELVRQLPAEMTVLLVEHDLDVVFGVADAVTVLHLGRHLITGTPPEVRASAAVQSAYLGAADTTELFGEIDV
jgi:branched-chain amino acid transport system ATP-binding protein